MSMIRRAAAVAAESIERAHAGLSGVRAGQAAVELVKHTMHMSTCARVTRRR